MITVTIDKAKWGQRFLRTRDGKYCCLGFCAKQAGVTDEEMSSCGLPGMMHPQAREKVVKMFPRMLRVDGPAIEHHAATFALASINDSGSISIEDKMKGIQAVGREIDIDFQFV